MQSHSFFIQGSHLSLWLHRRWEDFISAGTQLVCLHSITPSRKLSVRHTIRSSLSSLAHLIPPLQTHVSHTAGLTSFPSDIRAHSKRAGHATQELKAFSSFVHNDETRGHLTLDAKHLADAEAIEKNIEMPVPVAWLH
jgi:hypothetical protein